MEVVEGIPGKLPQLAPFPTAENHSGLPPGEWQACLDAWIFCVEFRLRLLPEHFRHFKLSQASSGYPFLLSYFNSRDSLLLSQSGSRDRPMSSKEKKLHRHCLLLLRRLLLETDIPGDFPARELFVLLASASSVFGPTSLWYSTLQQTWHGQQKLISAACEETKSYVIKMIAIGSSKGSETLQLSIGHITSLSRCLPPTGKIMMTGYDYIDCLSTMYTNFPSKLESTEAGNLKKLLTENLFVCLRTLMQSSDPSTSLLLDNLYGLKVSAEAAAKVNPNRPTLLSDLVCSTTFLRHLEAFLGSFRISRGDSVVQFLRSYKNKMSYLHPIAIVPKQRRQKGKGKTKTDHVSGEMHVHKAAQVSQIHELFPDLPTLYVLRLLDHFADDVEAVTSALLEPESLPQDLRDPESHTDDPGIESIAEPDLAPRSTPSLPAGRKNIFDDDKFDKLRISASQVHIGRRERHDYEPKDPSDKTKQKAAIMAALAAFDLDDDERDDTYDVADVGGAVDNTLDTDARSKSKPGPDHEEIDDNEQILFQAWRSNPEMFARDSTTRNSKPRQQIKRETGMTNEQIEGWASMLSRDEARRQKLENKYIGPTSFGGQQKALAKTKWSATGSGTTTEENTDADSEDGPGDGGASTRSRTLGVGRGYGRGRGKTSGSSNDAATQFARKRKEQGRGRGGANHNRREGHARKMGRGFGTVAPS